jgi:hypothetical protein
MNKLILTLFFLGSFYFGFAQAPVIYRSSPVVTVQDARLRAGLNFYVPVVNDTTLAGSLTGGLDSLGAIIQIRGTGNWYKRDTVSSGGHKWTLMGTNGGTGYPRIFNVEWYGAVHNGIQRFDGGCVNGSDTLKSSAASFTNSDIGKIISIDSAAASYGRLVTTIIAVVNSTTILLNTNASETVSSRMYVYGTDDTQAIQAAILDWYNRGAAGTIYFPDGRYIINGPIVGNGYNCQIYIPTFTIPVSSNQKDGIITLQGESPSSVDASILGLTNPPSNGVILHSTIDGTVVSGKYPSIIGTKWDSTNVANGANYNYLDAFCYNMTFVVKANNASHNGPTMSGLSFAECINDGGDHVQANIDMAGIYSVLPVNLSAGIITLTSNAATINTWSNTLSVGFRVGMMIGEHFDGREVQAQACWLGLNFEGSNHSAFIGKALVQWCPYSVGSVYGYDGVAVFAQRLYIDDLDIERMQTGTPWYAYTTDIYDSLNLMHGMVQTSVLRSGNTGVFAPGVIGAASTDFFYHSIYTDAVRQNAGGNIPLAANTSPFTLTLTNSSNTTTTQTFIGTINSGGGYIHLGNLGASYSTNGLYVANAGFVLGSAKLVLASTSAPTVIATDGGASSTPAVIVFNSTNHVALGKTTDDGSNMQVNGSMSLKYIAETSTYGIAATDYFIDCTANSFTVTLPTAVSIAGRVYVIKNSGSGTITIATTSSQTIDGSSPGTLSTLAQLRVISDGANWKSF